MLYVLGRSFVPKRGERSSCKQSENQIYYLHGFLLPIFAPKQVSDEASQSRVSRWRVELR
jgi:hypothetical protein